MSKSGFKWIDGVAFLIVGLYNKSTGELRKKIKENINILKPSLDSFDLSLSRLKFLEATTYFDGVIGSMNNILKDIAKEKNFQYDIPALKTKISECETINDALNELGEILIK